MKKKELLDDELKGLSPFLQEMKRKEDGFKLPADYFETFEQSVFQKLGAEATGMKIVHGRSFRSRFLQPRFLMAVAASLTIALSAWWFLKPSPIVVPLTPISMELTGEEVEAYVLENIQEFDTEQLVTLTEDNPAATELQAPSLPKSSKIKPASLEISPEDVENVLKDMSDEELEQLL